MRAALYSLMALAWLATPANAAKTISSKCQAIADQMMDDRFFVPLTASGPESRVALADGEQDAPQPLIRESAGLSRQFYRDLQAGDVFAGFNRRIVHGQWQLEVLYTYPDGDECLPFPKQAVKISVVYMPASVLQFFLRKFSQSEEGTIAEMRGRLQHALTVANQELAANPADPNLPHIVTDRSLIQDAIDNMPSVLMRVVNSYRDTCEKNGSVLTIARDGIKQFDIDSDDNTDFLLSGDALYCDDHLYGGGNAVTSLWVVTTAKGRHVLNEFSVRMADVYAGDGYAVVVTDGGASRLKDGKVKRLKSFQNDREPVFSIRR